MNDISQQILSVPFQPNIKGVHGDIWTILRDANPREYDRIAFKYGIRDHRAMLKKLTGVKKLNKKSAGI